MEYATSSVPRLAYQLARYLSERGQEVALVGTVRDRALEGEAWEAGLRTFKIHSDYPLRFRAARGLYNPDTVPKFREIVSRLRPDVVHVHNVHTYLSFYCLKVARQLGARVFLTAHDVMLFWDGKLACFDATTTLDDVADGRIDYRTRWWRALQNQRFRYLPLRNALVRTVVTRHADEIISVSDSLRQALARNGYRDVTTIHNGVLAHTLVARNEEAEGFRRRFDLGRGKVILAGGRLSYLKGIDHLLHAVALVSDGEVRIVIVGGGSAAYEKKLRRLTTELGIDHRTVFTGWIEGSTLRSAFAAADVCVNPSLCFETLSMFNLEAMAAQRPLVTTFFGGTRETIVDGESGLFVNPYRVEDLALRLSDLLADETRSASMGARGRERAVERFDAEKQMEKLVRLYETASR